MTGAVNGRPLPQTRVPGTFWYWVAGAVALAVTAAVIASIAWFVLTLDTGTQFLAPGRHTVDATEAGKYIVWNEYRTVFQGRSYESSKKLPAAVQITVFDIVRERALDVSPALGASSQTGATERVSVAQFTVEHPGPLEVAVAGSFEPRVLAVGPDVLPGILGVVFGSLALVFVGYGLAIGIAAWTYIQRDQARTAGTARPAAAPAATGAPAESSLKRVTALVYGLQIASFFVGMTFIAAVIVNYVKRKDVEGTWLESHFRWQIRTFWFGCLWGVIGLATAVVLIGFLVLVVSAAWVLYRAIKGWVYLEDGKPMPG